MDQPFDNTEEAALVPTDAGVIEQRPQTLTERMMDILNATEMMATLQARIIETAVKMTTAKDWLNMGGNPYLGDPGTTRVASMLPIRTEIVHAPKKQWEQDAEGPYYIYMSTARASWRSGLGSSEAIGTCSSRDKFFSTRGGQTIPQSEVDETNIIKKCATNARANATKGLLGLKKISWEDLERINGITQAAVQGVEYGPKKPADENPEEAKKLRADIGKMIMEMCNDDADEAAKYLEAMTTFKGREGKQVPGKKSAKHLSEKQAKVTYGKVKDQHAKWLATQGSSAPEGSPEDELQKDVEGMS